MLQELSNSKGKPVSDACPSVPQSILTANRYELTDITLKIEGTLPDDLHGHVFIVEPCGSIDSGGLPYPDGDSILGGDGMIYRLDFNQKGEVGLKSRLMKPPDYYADKATQAGTDYDQYRFRNHGITRFSLSLGCRNQLNTGFLPMKFRGDSRDRLLVTYDVGRPYELDTETLEAVTPVGKNTEWVGELDWFNMPFRLLMSTAHPLFDPYTNQMFTVNFGRSINSFMKTVPFIDDLENLPGEVEAQLIEVFDFFNAELLKDLITTFSKLFWGNLQLLASLLEKLIGIDMEDYVYVLSWDGSGQIERWKVVLPDRSPIQIQQCIHQIGMSEDYIVILDTSFMVGLEQMINNPLPHDKKAEELFRKLAERPAVPDSYCYIVRRRDLKAGQHPACNEQEVEVVAQKVVIPLASAHFLVDYDNPNGNITLHVSHLCGMEVSEWIRKYDVSVYPSHNPVPSRLGGMIQSETDIGRVGKYVVNGETGLLIDSCVVSQDPFTWGIELYAYRDRLAKTGLPPRKLDNIYWCSLGLWKELMTEFVFDLYKDYKYQLIPHSEILKRAEQGVPCYLFRLHTATMEIVDYFAFPAGHIILSPEFIPSNTGESSIDGHLVCTVYTPDRSEFWIFDARDLAQGPLCILHHPSLSFGFTLHTAWLPEIGRREASYLVAVREDFDYLVKRKSSEVQEFFEKEVYPHFEAKSSL